MKQVYCLGVCVQQPYKFHSDCIDKKNALAIKKKKL